MHNIKTNFDKFFSITNEQLELQAQHNVLPLIRNIFNFPFVKTIQNGNI